MKYAKNKKYICCYQKIVRWKGQPIQRKMLFCLVLQQQESRKREEIHSKILYPQHPRLHLLNLSFSLLLFVFWQKLSSKSLSLKKLWGIF